VKRQRVAPAVDEVATPSAVVGLKLCRYVVADGRVAEVRHALIGELPGEFRQP
jgi:hypothetical protein